MIKSPSLPSSSNRSTPLMDKYKNMQELLKGQYLYQRGVLNDVILRILSKAGTRPVMERINVDKMDSYLQTELENNGLNLPFRFAIINNKGKIVYNSPGYDPAVSGNHSEIARQRPARKT